MMRNKFDWIIYINIFAKANLLQQRIKMFYRRKIILALIEQFGGSLTKTDFQKYLFLYMNELEKVFFHFIPYKYGSFSFQAQQDISTMIKYKQIEERDSRWRKTDQQEYLPELKSEDRKRLVLLYNQYKNLKGRDLIRHVYQKYPYYAINSEIAHEILNLEDLNKVNSCRPKNRKMGLYTIGYEGKSVEEYTNLLVKENIALLCDVRKNPMSMKYGFSKKQLQNVLNNVGIEYLHIPELGIVSEKRQELKTYDDYKKLFSQYKTSTILQQQDKIKHLNTLIQEKHRIALTCFEADFKYCHRSIVAEAVYSSKNIDYELIHL